MLQSASCASFGPDAAPARSPLDPINSRSTPSLIISTPRSFATAEDRGTLTPVQI